MCVFVLSRHMKIHEKDPNSATAAAPPSPLKRRRLSSKRKLSHDAESEKEDPAPAKKVLSAPNTDAPNHGTWGGNTSSLYFCSLGTWQTSIRTFLLLFFSCCSVRCLQKNVPVHFLCGASLLSPLMKWRACSIVLCFFCLFQLEWEFHKC